MLLAENASDAKKQENSHRAEQHEIREFRQQPSSIGIEKPDDDAAQNRALEAPKSADDNDNERENENIPFRAWIERQKAPPTTPATPARNEPSAETRTNRRSTLMPVAFTISRSSTPARTTAPICVL